jgi:membrane protease YdiL (CAAX protease family)
MTPGESGPTLAPPVLEAAAKVRRRMRRTLWLTGATAGALAVLTPLPLLDVLAVPAFLVFLPGMAIAQLPLLEVERLERVPVYLGSIAAILVLGAVGAVLALRLEGVAPAGLRLLPFGELLLWTGGVTAAGLLVVAIFQPLDRRLGGGPRILSDLLPRTPRERGLFAGLSLSAGVGEELAYRAYAYQAVQLLGAGPWGAAVASSVPFGFLHAYQGPVGVARTAMMGFVLAVPVVVTGSLLPSMAAHTLLDLILGLVVGPRVVGDDGPAPVGDGPGSHEDCGPGGGAFSDLVPPDHED